MKLQAIWFGLRFRPLIAETAPIAGIVLGESICTKMAQKQTEEQNHVAH